MPLGATEGFHAAAQFFFTFLDFSALGAPSGDTLSLRWDEADAVLAPPPVGTDTFLAVRPVGDGELRVTLRASRSAFPDEASFASFTAALRSGMTEHEEETERRPQRRVQAPVRTWAEAAPAGVLDSALIGYLPPPGQLAALASLGAAVDGAASREQLRELLLPGGRPRLVEEIDTPFGRSGFVCLPLFADELASTADLSGRVARAVTHAASLGARSVSLAGMIPSLTGYGFGVLHETATDATTAQALTTGRATTPPGVTTGHTATPPGVTTGHTATPPALTTGHAATAVSVVKTVHAALARTGRELGYLAVAVAGLGSIGRSSLELLLTLAAEPPARLVLCDVAGSAPRLRTLAEDLTARGLARNVEIHESGPGGLPSALYEAGLLVTAVSGGGTVLDVSRLRPGTIVVDDSFPHCFDTTKALARMREHRDVLIVGGGLLSVGAVERRTAPGLPCGRGGRIRGKVVAPGHDRLVAGWSPAPCRASGTPPGPRPGGRAARAGPLAGHGDGGRHGGPVAPARTRRRHQGRRPRRLPVPPGRVRLGILPTGVPTAGCRHRGGHTVRKGARTHRTTPGPGRRPYARRVEDRPGRSPHAAS